MIDPEALKEVQASQADLHRNMANMQSMDVGASLSKFLAGDAPSGGAASPSVAEGKVRKRR